MTSAITNWDYFELYPLTRLARGRWMRLFVERPDGDWNFHPRGFGEPGYRVNDVGRVRLERISVWVRTPFEWSLVIAGCLAVYGPYRYPWLALGLAVLLWIVFRSLSIRRQAFDLLSRSTEMTKPLSAAQRQRRNMDEWSATPRTGKIWTVIMIAAFSFGAFSGARKLLSPGETLEHLRAGVSLAQGVCSALYLARLRVLARVAYSQAAVPSAASS